MQNPIDSPRFSTAIEPNLDVYANNSFQAPDQENIENPVTSEAQSPEYSPKATKFEPSITPDNRSNQSSPVNFNFLAEVGRAKRRSPTQSEDSNSLFVAKFENEHVDTSNINSKIAQILVESKSVSPDARHERFDLSFEMKTDCSIDVNDISDNMKQSHIKKQKKGKEPQNVAFDDSLNNDLFHDPNISSIAHVKTMDLSKRTDFIGLSQMHFGNEKEHENKTPNNMKEMKKVITTLEYKPERGRYEQMVQGHQALSLFDGVSEPNESRLSKMSEEEAAFLFESRKNTLMRGLQKLNKHRKVNITPKSNSQSPKARGSRNTTEKSPYSAGGDSSPGRQSVKGFVVENVEARRSKSSQHSKQHVNHQKAYKSVRVDTYEQLGITDSPVNGPVVVKKGRSLSHQDVKPLEIESLDLLDSSRITPGKNKIDEMYQMAKEDVKKRIASIDKRLVESEGLQSGRRSADSKPTRKTHSPRTQQITLTVVPNKERSVDKTDRSSKQKPKFATEPSPVNKNDKFKTERGRAFQEDAYQLVGKKVLTINLTPGDYEAMRKHGNNSKSPKIFEQQIKKKTEERINIIRKELSPSSQERPPSGRNAYDIKPTMQTQSYDGIKADTKKYSIEDNRYKQYDAKTVQRTPIGPPKFTDLEAMASQGNSYSQMHNEKRNKLLVNNRASEGVMKSGPIRAKESFGGPVKANMVYNLADAGTPRSKNKKNLHVRFSDQDKKEAQDVKYFVLRPEAEKVVNTKRTNPSTSAVKPNDRISLEINKRPSQESIPTKQAKIMRPLVNETNNVQNQQQSKIPRSSSFKQIKPYKNMEMLPTNPVDQRLKTCEPVYTVSEGKVKQTEPQVSSPRSTGSSWNAKPEKKRVPSVSKTQPKTWNKAITDRPSSPKTPYINKDAMTPQKKEPLVRNSVPVTQKKEKLIYATSVENMEELLSRNYRFLEIRNNQYVFTAN